MLTAPTVAGINPMRKLLALALLALALVGGMAFVSLETPTIAVACDGNCP
jgi:hypothetical protein